MRNKKGTTIIELILAMAMVAIGVLSIISLIVNSFVRTVPLSSKFTAAYLTQEGFEVVRRIRDKNFNTKYEDIENHNWTENLLEEDQVQAEGRIYYGSEYFETDNPEKKLYINNDGFYSYDDTGEETPFSRIIRLERSFYTFENNEDKEYISVTVEINWSERGRDYDYTAKTRLFNWY